MSIHKRIVGHHLSITHHNVTFHVVGLSIFWFNRLGLIILVRCWLYTTNDFRSRVFSFRILCAISIGVPDLASSFAVASINSALRASHLPLQQHRTQQIYNPPRPHL